MNNSTTYSSPDQYQACLALELATIRERLELEFETAPAIPAMSWQSTRAPQPMPEIFNTTIQLFSQFKGVPKAEVLAKGIGPSLPWADNHFIKDRVSGAPLNPGKTWRQWPYALSAANHRKTEEGDAEDPPFDHSYAERYWPKFAGQTSKGELTLDQISSVTPNQGVRSRYGDLKDLIGLLRKDPLTRQAYLPVWFPEDLYGAAIENRRVPCTLGYHFILRDGMLHCIYYMRSCDYVRHFLDDIYLTMRLQAWLLLQLKQLKKTTNPWKEVGMGTFTMHITSLHMFEMDRDNLRKIRKSGDSV